MWMQFNTILINHNLQWNLWQRQSCNNYVENAAEGGVSHIFYIIFWCSVVIKAVNIILYIHSFLFSGFRSGSFLSGFFSYCLLDFAKKFEFLVYFFFGYSVYDLIDVLPGCSLTRPFSSQIMILAFVGKLLNIYPKQ